MKKAADRDTYMTNYRLNKRKEVYKAKSEHACSPTRFGYEKQKAKSPKKSEVKQKKFKLNTDQQGQILGVTIALGQESRGKWLRRLIVARLLESQRKAERVQTEGSNFCK